MPTRIAPAADRIADRAVQIHGGAGYMEEYPVARFYRDVRLFRIYEGTSQIQQTVIAKGLIQSRNGEITRTQSRQSRNITGL